jgi:hypothetical protein
VQEQEGNVELCPPEVSGRSRRTHALGIAITAVALLVIAFFLSPSGSGVGTHRQLGLPECGWILAADIPCPTCGMTTAWSHTVKGELLTAFMTQPMGMVLAIAALFVAIGGFITCFTGYSFQPLLYRYRPSRIFFLLIALFLVSWGFKILLHKGIL